MRYYVQCKAPANNWYDVLGTDDKEHAVEFMNYQQRVHGLTAQVVERVDTVVAEMQ